MAGLTKKPGARPGLFSRGVLFAQLLPRVQRNANGKGLLPNRAFGTLKRAPDTPCGRLLPRHCLEGAKVALRPIATNPSSSNCHFDSLRLLRMVPCNRSIRPRLMNYDSPLKSKQRSWLIKLLVCL